MVVRVVSMLSSSRSIVRICSTPLSTCTGFCYSVAIRLLLPLVNVPSVNVMVAIMLYLAVGENSGCAYRRMSVVIIDIKDWNGPRRTVWTALGRSSSSSHQPYLLPASFLFLLPLAKCSSSASFWLLAAFTSCFKLCLPGAMPRTGLC